MLISSLLDGEYVAQESTHLDFSLTLLIFYSQRLSSKSRVEPRTPGSHFQLPVS